MAVRRGGARRRGPARFPRPAAGRGDSAAHPPPLVHRSGRRERPELPTGKDPARAGKGPEVTELPHWESVPFRLRR